MTALAGLEGYQRRIGRWSRLVAREFLDWLALPPQSRWLDLGCGTGALTLEIAERCQPARLIGIDPAGRSLAYLRGLGASAPPLAQASANALPIRDACVDACVSGLVLNFVS